MSDKFMRYAVTGAATLVLFLPGERAVAQMAEPQRAPEEVIAPADAAAVDTGVIGAAPVPSERGPLGEPAPPSVLGETTLEVIAEGPGEAAAPEAVATVDTPTDDAAESADEPIGHVLLGEPAPTPARRSMLPVIRTAARSESVPAFGTGSGLTGEAFLNDQLTHQRVIDAQLDAKFDLKALFAERGLTYPPRDIYFRLFKQEQVLEVWVRETPQAETYTLLREYPICAIPGRLGPKTRTNDFQAPEGFYYIEGFNPQSDFHLSLRLNYPNPADRIIGVEHAPGGDIYIHGGCSTVGCFPMTDEAIAEIYWLAVQARAAGQNVIPVHVFPARMHPQGMAFLRRTFERDTRLVAFWENLREGYDWFETTRTLPRVSVDPAGHYVFAAAPPPERPAAGAPPAEPALLGEELPGAERPAGGAPAAEPVAAEPLGDAPLGDAVETPATVEAPAADAPLGAELPATTP